MPVVPFIPPPAKAMEPWPSSDPLADILRDSGYLQKQATEVNAPGVGAFDAAPLPSSETVGGGFRDLSPEGVYRIGPIFIAALGAQVVFNVFMVIKYSSSVTDRETAFFNQNTAMLLFAALGLAMFAFFSGRPQVGKYEKGATTLLLLGAITPLIIQGVLQLVFGIAERLKLAAVTPLETFLFYVSVAISEEVLFRVGLQLSLSKTLRRFLPPIYASIISVGVAASVFAFAHSIVYAEDLSAIWIILATGVGLGALLEVQVNGVYYLDAPVLGHFVLNFYVGYQRVIAEFGGF